ncbi:serine/threonine-protein kinase [Kamptonema cortianum]|nr:serine/threonine-protein kinase [Geitlerinema splendidum]MDK3162165.1 serine/threonine-protein kinase [Kamptonema cortianum]
MSHSNPDTLGKYQLIREIARSNDIVFEGYDPVMNRRVAVKELNVPQGSTDAQKSDRVKRFMREAKAAGSLVHPNIVTVYDVEVEDGRYYLAMEYLDGHTLRKELENEGFIDPPKAVEIAIEVLKALSFAHKNGVVHRDVKPENIQLLENGAIKLTDFGIARLTFEPNITMDGQVFGTPSYMSPEQINGKEIDARSDIFSIGVVLYEMISGTKPFSGDSVVSITYAIMNREPAQPPQANHTLWQVIQKALDKSPALRYDSAEDMMADLKTVLKGFSQSVLDPVSSGSSYNTPPQMLTGPPPQVSQVQPYGQSAAYGPQGQPLTPYGTPMPPGAGPIMTPYGQPSSQQMPYVPYGQAGLPQGLAPPPQVPVYYPPPPRKPWVSQETKGFFGRLFLAFLFVASLAAVVIYGLDQIGRSVRESSSNGAANQSRQSNPSQSSGTAAPPAAVAESRTNSPVPDSPATSTGGSSASSGLTYDQLIQAADQLVLDGARADVAMFRRDSWKEASQLYTSAIDVSPSPRQVKAHAANQFCDAAELLIAAGDQQGAREVLYNAQAFSDSDARVQARIANLLAIVD